MSAVCSMHLVITRSERAIAMNIEYIIYSNNNSNNNNNNAMTPTRY